MHDLLQSIAKLDPVWIYTIIFLVAYIENIFPPSPSDVIVVFGGALAGMGHGTFFFALLAGTFGSTFGFLTMYQIGRWFGRQIIETKKLKFIPLANVHKIEIWFLKYGYWVIAANRFLAGTRAVVSFFAGLSGLNLPKTSMLSFFSSLMWYSLLIYSGYSLGKHWERVMLYLTTYSQITTGVILLIAVGVVARYFIGKNNSAKK